MKKVFLFFIFLSGIGASAQDNEVKLDLLDILLLRTLDISYERLLNDEASVGVSTFINFEAKNNSFRYNEDFQITPYFRRFVAELGGFDVFGELFGSLNFAKTDKKKDSSGNIVKKAENYSDFALGLGAGIKHVSGNGYIFELNAGVGRNLFNAKISREFVPRFGISIGKQF